jgi:hypothetical protein
MRRHHLSSLGAFFLLAMASSYDLFASDSNYFYQPADFGSESLFNPISSFVNYTLDSAQVKESFGTSNYRRNLGEAWNNLLHPGDRINEEGTKSFINTEITPIDIDELSDSKAILPNYGLHLFGGGLVYRKNAEWFRAHDYPAPFFTAALLSMTAEILAEGLEKPVTDDTDEIADVYLFRPLGIWLFSNDKRAKWIKENLDPVDWPHLIMYDQKQEELLNIGISYVVRPQWLRTEERRAFVYMGITNLIGVSHRQKNGDEFSWGLGVSTESINPTELRPSAGIFYDRNNSLLASGIINGTEQLRLRINVYPGAFNFERLARLNFPLGFFVGLSDDNQPAFGFHFGLPLGLGATF